MTITITAPALATLDSLLDHLHAAPAWSHSVTVDSYGDRPMAIFRRVEGPFAGYSLNVPLHDDAAWVADVAEIVNGVEQGRMPACGLDGDVIIRAIDAITAICGPDRTGPATPSEAVALLAVSNPWHIADEGDRQVLRGICNGRPLEQMSGQSIKALGNLAVRLASLILA